MSRYNCDFHIHSCLSPCADNEMTPGNIAGMALINGLRIVALTDHNTSKNCPPFFEHAKSFGLIPIAGMELTTAEDIHVVCLFRSLDAAMEFDKLVEARRPQIKNKPEIFGNQYLCDFSDDIVGDLDILLINASDISLEEAFDEVKRLGGVCYPAHIDRQSNGIISVLGAFPPQPEYTCFELHNLEKQSELSAKYPILNDLIKTYGSDAHRLEDISDGHFSIEIPDDNYSSDNVRNTLIDMLLSKQVLLK